MKQTPVLIIGAGAAGLKCAATYGSSCTVLEHNKKPGLKILISGGGRCNFTNTNTRPENFISNNPAFVKSALSRYRPEDTLKWVEEARIAFEEKHRGQMFCRKSSKEILSLLLEDCHQNNVDVKTGVEVRNIKKKNDCFEVETSHENYQSQSLVLATGGLSFPRLGVSDLGFKIASQWGHNIVELTPSLVSLSYSKKEKPRYKNLSGVSLPVVVKCNKTTFHEDLLFTHEGLSGPAILQISNMWNPGDTLHINLLPDVDWDLLFSNESIREKEVLPTLSTYLPKRLVHVFLSSMNLDKKKFKQIQHPERRRIEDIFSHWKIIPETTGGWEKAEVTRGGIDTREINSKNMESKKVSGLYFIGEVLDVTGHLGGFNFQWAFASGYVCGLALKK